MAEGVRFLEDTPLERWDSVYVKRDDLYGQAPAPPLAKLRGARVVVDRLYREGVRDFATFDTRVSKAGQGISAVLLDYPGTTISCYYPRRLGDTEAPVSVRNAQELGAKPSPVRASRTGVSWGWAMAAAKAEGQYMLPFGLLFPESSAAVRVEAERTVHPEGEPWGTVVVSVGTAIMLSGLCMAFQETPVYGVSCGMNLEKQLRRVYRTLGDRPTNLHQRESGFGYYDRCDVVVPFPSSPYYDKKAWHWMNCHLPELKPPVLFWNIGA